MPKPPRSRSASGAPRRRPDGTPLTLARARASTTSGASERTPKGERTRAALIEAARKVFERDGFLNARITDISAAAGLAHGSFYTYFGSKEAIFREVIVDLRREIMAFVDEYPSGDDPATPDIIERAHTRYLRTYRDNAALIRIWLEVATLDPEVESLMLEARRVHVTRTEHTIRALQIRGLADTELDPRATAHALVGMLPRFASAWFAEGDPRDLDEGVRQLARLWTNAVRLEPTSGSADDSPP